MLRLKIKNEKEVFERKKKEKLLFMEKENIQNKYTNKLRRMRFLY